MWVEFFNSFANLLEPINILALLLGCFIGIVFGAMPGLGPTIAASLLVPFTYAMPPVSAIILIAATYVTGTFGGSQTAILFNIPGSPENNATALDGYKLTKKGKAKKTLDTAIISSTLGGVFATIVLIISSSQLVKISYLLGAAEYFALALFGLIVIITLSKSFIKGLITALFGVLLSAVGMSSIDSTVRLTFNQDFLLNGFEFVPIMIGAYAIGELFYQIQKEKNVYEAINRKNFNNQSLKFRELLALKYTIARSSLLGIFIGALPGAGAVLAGYLGYGIEEKIQKGGKHQLGEGELRGVAAPESANNSAAVSTFIPLLALGIPGGAVTAILLGVFEVHGLQAGPLLFVINRDLVYILFAAFFVINISLLLLGFIETKIIVKLIRIKPHYLYPAIFVFATVGSYAVSNSIFNVVLMVIFGLLGFVMKKYGYSIGIMVLGLVLGPILENNLMRTLIITESPLDLLKRPLFLMFIFLILLTILLPKLRSSLSKDKNLKDLSIQE